MAAYCTEYSHSWLYIRSAGDNATPGNGGEMDRFSITGHLWLVVVEGPFTKEKDEPEIVKSVMHRLYECVYNPEAGMLFLVILEIADYEKLVCFYSLPVGVGNCKGSGLFVVSGFVISNIT